MMLFLKLISHCIPVARAQSDPDVEIPEPAEENTDLGIVGEDVQDFGDETFNPAPGIETVSVFPKNIGKGEGLYLRIRLYSCICCYFWSLFGTAALFLL